MSETTAVAEAGAPPTESAWAGPPDGATPPTALPADTAPADTAPPAPPAEPPAPVPAAPAAQPPPRSVHVPMWILGALAVVVLVVGAFFVGRESAPESSPSGPTTLAEAVEDTARGEMSVGEFDVQDLIAALQQNGNLSLDLNDLLDLLGGR